ncbi:MULTISPECIES: arsenic transporter [Parageobacillus]|nr:MULTISPECIES: arsenic transporter [Parageobacillus]BDG46818.1 putative arsenical pump membrane protein [Parageobacillus sp. KH3-4]
MDHIMTWLTAFAFFFTLLLIYWRPKGLNEAIPATIGAMIVIFCGTVSMENLLDISSKVSGAALTIISTLIMALVLESVGVFHWVATYISEKAKGSGIRLFCYTNLLCFFMTIFFNNDGSIIITTPILLLIVNCFQLKRHQKLPYLISGALIATASSAPIGVSNIVNLIALKIINMDLYMHTAMMFIPSMIGLLFLFGMLLAVFYKDIPKMLPPAAISVHYNRFSHHLKTTSDWKPNKINARQIKWILVFVFLVRMSIFIASYLGIPEVTVAIAGSVILLGWRWYYAKTKPYDVLLKAPWHILVFATGMYVVIYGLNNIGFSDYLIRQLSPYIGEDLFPSIFVMGSAVSILSNVFNNHPALMIGTMALTNLNVEPIMLKAAYLASIIGSDIGSLLLPIGTLATLLWMHLLKRHHEKISWTDYMKITFVVIPPTVFVTLFVLYCWMMLFFI